MAMQDWVVVGASVQGASHKVRQQPCQDAHAVRVLAGGQLAIAVADGAGSAARSDEGAGFVTATALDLLEEALRYRDPRTAAEWQALVQKIFVRTYELLAAFANAEAAPLRAFAATLSLVYLSDSWTVIGQIGDGLVVTADADDTWQVAVLPERGEYANETHFLLSAEQARNVTCVASDQAVTQVAVSTDGLLRLAVLLPTYQPHRQFFVPLFELLDDAEDLDQLRREITAWLGSDAITARTDDDTTLVLAMRRLPLSAAPDH